MVPIYHEDHFTMLHNRIVVEGGMGKEDACGLIAKGRPTLLWESSIKHNFFFQINQVPPLLVSGRLEMSVHDSSGIGGIHVILCKIKTTEHYSWFID